MTHVSRLDSLRWTGDSLAISFTLRRAATTDRRADPHIATSNRGIDVTPDRVEVRINGGDRGYRLLPVTWHADIVSRAHGPDIGPSLVGEAVLTPVDARTGDVLAGAWEVQTVWTSGSNVSIGRMSAGICQAFDTDGMPAFVGRAPTYVEVALTHAAGLLVCVDAAARTSLHPGVTVPRFKNEVGNTDDGAAVRVPLRVHLAHNRPVSTTLALTPIDGESTDVIRVRAIIVRPQTDQPAWLVATVPGGAIRSAQNVQSWALHAEFGDTRIRLNHTLSHGGEPDPMLYLGPAVTGEAIRRRIRAVGVAVCRAVPRLPRARASTTQ